MAYKGIHGHDDDTTIQISTKNMLCNESNVKQCHGDIKAETPAITQTANIGNTFSGTCILNESSYWVVNFFLRQQ